ncbi:MAG: hypothetical protein ACI9W2_003519 [Gammaproteobacteria bacterium]|jgi:hypothetical protein
MSTINLLGEIVQSVTNYHLVLCKKSRRFDAYDLRDTLRLGHLLATPSPYSFRKTRVGEIHVRQIRVRNKGTMATPIPTLTVPKQFAALYG